MNLQNVMTTDPACATPATPLVDVARMMLANDCGLLPVVDDLEHRQLLGVISDRDIVVRAIAQSRNPLTLTTEALMTAPALWVEEDTDLADCCELMETNRIRRLPVRDAQGRVCGIVSLADLARHENQAALVGEVVREVSTPAR